MQSFAVALFAQICLVVGGGKERKRKGKGVKVSMCGGWCERVARLSACSRSGVGFTFFLSFSGTSSACAWLFPATETKAAAASKAALRAKCLLVSWVVASVLPLLSCALALTTTARVALALAATGARLVIVVLVIAFMACVVYSGKALGLVVLFQLASFQVEGTERQRDTAERERERSGAPLPICLRLSDNPIISHSVGERDAWRPTSTNQNKAFGTRK